MAREAGYFLYDLTETHGIKTVETDEDDQWAQLERFAAIVAAAEREQCAAVCEELVVHEPKQEHPLFIAGQHRAKRNCAAAIRAR